MSRYTLIIYNLSRVSEQVSVLRERCYIHLPRAPWYAIASRRTEHVLPQRRARLKWKVGNHQATASLPTDGCARLLYVRDCTPDRPMRWSLIGPRVGGAACSQMCIKVLLYGYDSTHKYYSIKYIKVFIKHFKDL